MVFTEQQIEEQEKLLHPSELKIPKNFLGMLRELKLRAEIKTVEDVIQKREIVDKRSQRWQKSNTGNSFPLFFKI